MPKWQGGARPSTQLSIARPCRRRPASEDSQEVSCLPYQVPSESYPVFPTIASHYPIPGIELFVIAIWRRSKTKPIGVLAHRHSNAPHPRSFPPEIVEMIIAHLQDDIPTLRACAATSFCWYSVAFPHLHHTLVLREWISKEHPYPLPSLSNLGLLSYVEKLNFNGTPARDRWVVPAIFNSGGMQYFRAMENLQELTIVDLDFTKFRLGLGEYLGHFAPTLRSVALTCPRGNRRQLLDFFRLFPKLDDIEISCYNAKGKRYKPLDPQVPITGGLRGRLTLKLFEEDSPGLLEDIIIAFGGMRFTSMNLWRTSGMQLLLETCADTLETLRICPEEIYSGEKVLVLGYFPRA